MMLKIVIIFFTLLIGASLFIKRPDPECHSKETVITIKEVGSNYSIFTNENGENKKVYNKSYKVGEELCSSEMERELK